MKEIYGTPYVYTRTGLGERGVRTLKESFLPSIKPGERIGKASDFSLEVMRTPHTTLKNSAFEVQGHESQIRKSATY